MTFDNIIIGIIVVITISLIIIIKTIKSKKNIKLNISNIIPGVIELNKKQYNELNKNLSNIDANTSFIGNTWSFLLGFLPILIILFLGFIFFCDFYSIFKISTESDVAYFILLAYNCIINPIFISIIVPLSIFVA